MGCKDGKMFALCHLGQLWSLLEGIQSATCQILLRRAGFTQRLTRGRGRRSCDGCARPLSLVVLILILLRLRSRLIYPRVHCGSIAV
jgi:hypothetical protein